MRHYCSLADSKYLPQLLALYESLKRHSSEEFKLHVLAMDDECAASLNAMNLGSVHVVSVNEFEQLLFLGILRAGRTWQEYCWTLGSVFTEAVLNGSGLIDATDMESVRPTLIHGWITDTIDEITYLDADLMFFSDPKVIHDEIGERSIAVIPHRFIPSKQYLEVNGKFNVSWVTFKNNPVGRECLSTWAAQCREKCSLKDGCGDQKYLDAWPQKYGHELCIIQNIGAGLAPWNLANYELTAGPKVDGRDVVFHHYHEFRELPVSKLDHRIADMAGIAGNRASYRLTNYELRPEDITLIYEPYIQAVTEAKDRIETISV